MRQERRHAPTRQPRSEQSDQSFAFRRSRTITGSAAPSVRSAGEDRAQLKSPRLHEHSLRKHRRRLGLVFIVCLAVIAGLWYVISSYLGDAITVSTASSQSVVRELDSERYQGLVKKYLQDRPFERFRFAFNSETFSNYMTQAAPEVESAMLSKVSALGQTDISMQLREPVVSWTLQNKPYFVDASGEAYTVNYFATPSVVVTDRSGITSEAGVVASSKLLRFIGRVITLVNQAGIAPIERVELPSNSTREVDLKLKDREYIIKANLDRDPAGQATDIINAVRYVDAKGITPKYLDLRVSSKAYYQP